MSLSVILLPEAEEDAEQIRDEMEKQLIGSGAAFLVRLRALLERIELMPAMYPFIWQQVRAARLRRSPFLVYYRVLADRVEVVAVIHGSRTGLPGRVECETNFGAITESYAPDPETSPREPRGNTPRCRAGSPGPVPHTA